MISRWRIVMHPDANGFDFNTLSDVVLHIRYTAHEGGERLKQGDKTSLVQALGAEAIKPLARLFSLKHQFQTEWHQFTHPAAPAVDTFTIDKERFPFLFRGQSKTLTVRKVHLYALLKHGAEPALPLRVAWGRARCSHEPVSPPPRRNRACGFHRTRLPRDWRLPLPALPLGLSGSSRSLPPPPSYGTIDCPDLHRGQSSYWTRTTSIPWRPSPCTRLSRAPSTMTPPTLISDIGRLLALTFRYEPPTFTKMNSARYCRWRFPMQPIPLFAVSRTSFG
jgi:hypothetical protein